MREAALHAYRFSISWSRVLPTGRGTVNPEGLAFYDRLVDTLLAANIQPWLTLFHWDYPLALYQEGGWLHKDIPQWFADYVRLIVDKLSDRVSRWMTLNEPQCFIGLGHQTGIHAPGVKLPLDQTLLAAHRVQLAHGLAVQTIRTHAKLRPLIGWAPTGDVAIPATETAEDIAAAREAYWRVSPDNVWNMAWWLDPVFKGKHPEQGLQAYGAAVPEITDADLRTIHQPLDFLGLNIYQGYLCQGGKPGAVNIVPHPTGHPETHNHWPVTPGALRWGPYFAHERYGLPIVITESGMASHDWVSQDKRVHDPQRIDYLARYIGELGRAISDGVPILGYFAWSFMDNFEWAEGYRYRFGLVHVDYATQKRTLKDSALWYRNFIRANGQPNSQTIDISVTEPGSASVQLSPRA